MSQSPFARVIDSNARPDVMSPAPGSMSQSPFVRVINSNASTGSAQASRLRSGAGAQTFSACPELAEGLGEEQPPFFRVSPAYDALIEVLACLPISHPLWVGSSVPMTGSAHSMYFTPRLRNPLSLGSSLSTDNEGPCTQNDNASQPPFARIIGSNPPTPLGAGGRAV